MFAVMPPLNLAAANGQIPRVRSLLASGANPNSDDDDGDTPLIAAIKGLMHEPDRLPTVRLLIKNGATINMIPHRRRMTFSGLTGKILTPFMWAINRRRFNIARYLLTQGASLTLGFSYTCAKEFQEMCHIFLKMPHSEIFMKLVRIAFYLDTRVTPENAKAYMQAVSTILDFKDMSDIPETLIKAIRQWIDHHRELSNRESELKAKLMTDLEGYLASLDIDLAEDWVLEEDLLKGLSPYDNYPGDFLSLKARFSFILKQDEITPPTGSGATIAAHLIRFKTPHSLGTTLRRAAFLGQDDAVKALVEFGVDVNDVDTNPEKGFSALHLAAQKSNISTIECLLTLGANPALASAAGKKAIEMTEDPRIHALLAAKSHITYATAMATTTQLSRDASLHPPQIDLP